MPASRHRLGLMGTGVLADAIASVLAGTVERFSSCDVDLAAVFGDCPMIVSASDGWDVSRYPALHKACVGLRIPWLPVRTELGRAVIGPIDIPQVPGCPTCAELRRQLARDHPERHDTLWQQNESELAGRPSSWLTGLAADTVAALVADEVRAVPVAGPVGVGPGVGARARNALIYVDLKTLAITTHRFLPDPLCPDCGGLPADSMALAVVELEPRRKTGPSSYRLRSVAEEFDQLTATYVDPECGLVRALEVGSEGGLAIAGATIGSRSARVHDGYGRSGSYRTSQTTALLEALERYGGGEPGGKRTVIRASYADVRNDAIDPCTLGLHAPDRYRLPGFRFKPFNETQPYRWVWAYSFARNAPILVPESIAYYGLNAVDPEHVPFAFEVSNGCALGSSLEEAILHGILEVAERDAFLMTWYARLPVPSIDIGSARNREVPLIAEAIETSTNHRVMVFNTTLEQRIPCVWALAVGVTDDQRPMAACAAGAHPDPERAVKNALCELGPILADLIRHYPEQHKRACEMADNPSLVEAMSDHRILYGNPAIFNRLNFLSESADVQSLADLPYPVSFQNADLRDDLAEIIRRYIDTGLDVIVVNQTTPEHRAGQFSCVKVIVPGTLPMTFGHDFRRVDGLPRLCELPHRLGYRDTCLSSADINPYPHPFP